MASFHDNSPTSRVGFPGEGLFSYFSTFTYLEFLFAHITFDVLSFIFYYFSPFDIFATSHDERLKNPWGMEC